MSSPLFLRQMKPVVDCTAACRLMRFFPVLRLLFVALLTLTQASHADITDTVTGKRPPIAKAVNVKVVRGQEADIVLNAVTASSKQVSFSVISQPAEGGLVSETPKQADKSSAVLRYKSRLDSKAATDSFRYTCRIDDGPVSAAAEVRITLVDLIPNLAVDRDLLDFGEIRYGTEKRLDLVVRNTGTGPYRGTVEVPEGWLMETGESIRELVLQPSQSLNLTLRCVPRKLGTVQKFLTFSGSGVRTSLKVLTQSPFIASSTLFFPWNPGQPAREATLMLQNPGSESITVGIALQQQQPDVPGTIDFPPSVDLAAGATQSVPLKMVKGITGSYRATLKLSALGAAQELYVGADPAPGQLQISGDIQSGVVDFGELDTITVAVARKYVRIRNDGGTPVNLYAKPLDSFTLSGFEQGMTIQPGTESLIGITPKPEVFGTVIEKGEWKWEGKTFPMTVQAQVKLQAGKNISFGTPNYAYNPLTDDTPIDEQNQHNVDQKMRRNLHGMITGNFKFDIKLPKPGEITQLEETDTTITLLWPVMEGEWTYTLMCRTASTLRDSATAPGSPNTLSVIWVPSEKLGGKTTITRRDRYMQCVVSGLQPGAYANVAVIATNSDGYSTLPGKSTSVFTAVKSPPAWYGWQNLLKWGGLLGLLWYLIRTYRRLRSNYKPVPRTWTIQHYDTSPQPLSIGDGKGGG